MKIGVITIGQSPRSDLIPEFEQALGAVVEIIQKGALDGLKLEEVKQLHPEEGDYILVTRMRDGTEVKIAERFIKKRMLEKTVELEKAGVELIVLLCTGEFPELACPIPLLKPDLILEKLVTAVLPSGLLAAVVPSSDQIPMLRKKWEKTGLSIFCESLSPYTGTENHMKAVALRIKEQKPDLVVLDCLGYSRKVQNFFRDIIGKPVILPRTLLGNLAGVFLGR
jgi:protein AroM